MHKTCKNCAKEFEITDGDLKFLEKVSPIFNGKKYEIPSPTLCPDCRQQRRLAFRNERSLYKRKCDKTGKQIISIYSEDKPYIVYDQKILAGDEVDPLDYRREFEFNKPFFDQFDELLKNVPKASILTRNCENSDYAPWAIDGKNLYLSAGGKFNEDCMYGMFPTRSKDCMDFIMPVNCELCYEIVESLDCYHVFFSQLCENCRDCYFCYDCRGCENCFCCSGLRKKKYCYMNEQLSKEEYENCMSKLKFTHPFVEQSRSKLENLKKNLPRIFSNQTNTENCTGDMIKNSRNSKYVFDVQDCEDSTYCYDIRESKDNMDFCIGGFKSELIYECHSGTNNVRGMGLNVVWEGNNDAYYCDSCFSISNCFACAGLRHKKYCILNKQYSKEEYEKLTAKIAEHMIKTKEFGEFFPINLSAFGYNETSANEYFPLSKAEVLQKGWKWHDDISEKITQEQLYKIPESIYEVNEDICNKILICKETNTPYKIIPQELKFYKRMGLPIPQLCPNQRHKHRMSLRNPRNLWDRKCIKCETPIKTPYAPTRPEKVYCEKCYLKEVY